MRNGNNSALISIAASLGVIAIGAIAWRELGHSGNREIAVVPPAPRIDAPSTVPSVLPSIMEDVPRANPQPVVSALPKIAKSAGAQPSVSTNAARPKSAPHSSLVAGPDIVVDDRPVARQALSLVGADSAAETIWAQAINDPNTSAHDRKDLIEDLNEDGFPDPHHVTADDLPLIENRIALIEQLAPQSMDEVNSRAFAEAYKDLVNMRAKAMNQ